MRIAIPVVIEMSDEQVKDWAAEFGLPRNGGKLMAREVVEDIRSYVLTCIQGGELGGFADVSIKGR